MSFVNPFSCATLSPNAAHGDPIASVPFPLRLKPDLKDRLKAAAQNEDMSAIDMASSAIERFLDARGARRLDLEAAIAEADKGVFVSWEAVERWMASCDTDHELPMPEPDIFPDDNSK